MDALMHLARSWLRADPKRGSMTVFTAYFDDSGTRGDSESLTVAGFIASVEQWDKLRAEWEGVLKDCGVSHLHMKDFAHSRKQFASWKGDEPKRRAFLNRLVAILSRRTRHSFSSAVILKDHKLMNELYPLDEEFGGPYPICVRTTIALVDDWQKRHLSAGDVVKFVYEDGAEGKGFIIDNFVRSSDIAFMKKGAHPALEAADFVAYEHTNVYRRVAHLKFGKIRVPYMLIRDSVPNTWRLAKRRALQIACESTRLKKRKSD